MGTFFFLIFLFSFNGDVFQKALHLGRIHLHPQKVAADHCPIEVHTLLPTSTFSQVELKLHITQDLRSDMAIAALQSTITWGRD